jgi:hypothetical protein
MLGELARSAPFQDEEGRINNAGHRLGRAEEGLGRRHVAVLAQHGIDEIAVTVDGAVQIAPPATNRTHPARAAVDVGRGVGAAYCF